MREVAAWGTIKFKGDVEGVIREIKSIGDDATTDEILEYAKANPDSELHKCYDWNIESAAEKYWKYTTRQIVCNINITYVNDDKPDKEPVTVRWFYKNDRAEGYKETTTMVQNIDEYAKLLATAKGELQAFKRKYKLLSELETVFDAIDAL